jgi:hypothetical protein
LAVVRAFREVRAAEVLVRRAELFVADALRLAAFRFLVAAARFAAAWRRDGDCVAMESVLLVSFFLALGLPGHRLGKRLSRHTHAL